MRLTPAMGIDDRKTRYMIFAGDSILNEAVPPRLLPITFNMQ